MKNTLVKELNEEYGIECRLVNLYGESVLVVDNKKDLQKAKELRTQYGLKDLKVDVPMTVAEENNILFK